MRTLLALLIILALCTPGLAAPQTQGVGADFGKAWLAQNANKFTAAPNTNNSNDLWNWGSKPQGYEVVGGQLYPIIAPTQTFYPAFVTNTTPIVVNGTAFWGNRNYASPDFMTPDFMYPYYMSPYYSTDPWFLAQIMERPVVVRYPANTKGSALL